MDEDGLTHDAFLNGRVHAWQPRKGYRAGADAVLLAASVPAARGEHVLEIGAGVGVVALCLVARIEGVRVTAVERDTETAALCRRNADATDADISVIEADLSALPDPIRTQTFDHVMMNPPYFRGGMPAPGQRRAAARHEQTPLADWIAVGLRRLKPGGSLSLIQRAERLGEALGALSLGAGAIRVLPIVGRAGQPASRVIVTAIKGAKAPLSLGFPLVLHDGAAHERDCDTYGDAARAILRAGMALSDVHAD